MIYVASYCRVSTDKDDQANSFASQQNYFRDYIARQPDWALYRVYADEGLSGTGTRKRTAFNQMIRDARMGKFKLIITKEVSRFSRNILDTIAYTRELKALGVGVLFMNDGISTLEPDAELRLSIMGSIAQEESRRTSSRVKWGQTRQMERGVVFGRSLLGYDVQDGRMTVNEEGAALVRLIFQKYGIEHKGTSVIARELREAGYKTLTGNTKWNSSHIVKILRNEKYVGDLVQKKTYTPDYLSHQKLVNHGAEEKICLTDHHEPIISRALWNAVQAELDRRNRHGALSAGHGNRYLFSGKIRCGLCGAAFTARKKRYQNGTVSKKWGCFTAANEGTRHLDPMGNPVGCDIGQMLRDDFAEEVLRTTVEALLADPKWTTDRVTAWAADPEPAAGESPEDLDQQIKQIMEKKGDILDAYFSKDITKEEMKLMNERYDRQLKALQCALLAAREHKGPDAAEIGSHIRSLAAQARDEAFLRDMLDTVTVHPGRKLVVSLHILPENLPLQRCLNDPAVPISVSSPFSSSKGME